MKKDWSPMHWLFIALLGSTLALPGGYVYLPLFLAGMGIFAGKDAWHREIACWRGNLPFRWVMGGLFVYALTYCVLGVHHGVRLRYFEAMIPFVLAPAMLVGLRRISPEPRHIWLGFAVGALAGALVGLVQVLGLGIPRAFGGHGNPIPYGHMALIMAGACVCAFLYTDRIGLGAAAIRRLYLAGAVAGCIASILSGSKGGWFAILILLLVFAWHKTSTVSRKARLLALLVMTLAFPLALWMAPHELVMDRLAGGWHGASRWFQTGEITEGSVSLRLETWRFGWSMFQEKPWMGWPSALALQAKEAHLRQFGLSEFLTTVGTYDNQFISVLVSGGLLGFLGVVALFAGSAVGFGLLWQRSQEPSGRAAAEAALLMVVFLIGYSMSVSVLGINAFRMVQVCWSMVWLSMSINRPGTAT